MKVVFFIFANINIYSCNSYCNLGGAYEYGDLLDQMPPKVQGGTIRLVY